MLTALTSPLNTLYPGRGSWLGLSSGKSVEVLNRPQGTHKEEEEEEIVEDVVVGVGVDGVVVAGSVGVGCALDGVVGTVGHLPGGHSGSQDRCVGGGIFQVQHTQMKCPLTNPLIRNYT